MGIVQSYLCNWTRDSSSGEHMQVGEEMGGKSSKGTESEHEQCGCPILEIPLAGNAFITQRAGHDEEVITEYGLGNWVNKNAKCSVYFCPEPGELQLSLRLSVPGNDKSEIKVSMVCELCSTGDGSMDCHSKESYNISIEGNVKHDVPVGQFTARCHGYVRLDLEGVNKTGGYFADVSHVLITATSCKTMMCVNEDFSYHFGRRGPSVHLSYKSKEIDLSCGDSGIEYFYSEVTVPEGMDAIGSYFCAIGFSGGYFGIQVNSSEERRVLFSIWSNYSTDDPDNIPEDYRVQLNRKGSGVHVGEFGNEGSGGQSYLIHNWVAGVTYKFLVRGRPIDQDNSEFSGWFFSPILEKWSLIASFIQPKKSTYLSGIYSFCENFKPETGYLERMAYYGNQWARHVNSNWHEITTAKFTGDETSKKCRCDFAGGASDQQFFLKNCGFSNGKVEVGQTFSRNSTQRFPNFEISELP